MVWFTVIEFFYLFLKILSEQKDDKEDNCENENINIRDIDLDIDINEIVDLFKKIIILIINSVQDILNNREKFILIREKDYYENNSNSSYNILFFDAFIFLSESLLMPEIKQEFSSYIDKFIMNIIFPILITIDEYEIKLLDLEPEIYQQYLDNVLFIFKERTIRNSASYLLSKICDGYINATNFCFGFCIQLMQYLIDDVQFNNEENTYIKYIKESNLNKFNNKEKFDLALLIILLLRNRFNPNNSYLKMNLRYVLMKNQEKIHTIEDSLIKIKLCRIYNNFLSILISENENESKVLPEVKIIFVETAINFLLNNIP